MLGIVAAFEATTVSSPLIPMGAPDPYLPRGALPEQGVSAAASALD